MRNISNAMKAILSIALIAMVLILAFAAVSGLVTETPDDPPADTGDQPTNTDPDDTPTDEPPANTNPDDTTQTTAKFYVEADGKSVEFEYTSGQSWQAYLLDVASTNNFEALDGYVYHLKGTDAYWLCYNGQKVPVNAKIVASATYTVGANISACEHIYGDAVLTSLGDALHAYESTCTLCDYVLQTGTAAHTFGEDNTCACGEVKTENSTAHEHKFEFQGYKVIDNAFHVEILQCSCGEKYSVSPVAHSLELTGNYESYNDAFHAAEYGCKVCGHTFLETLSLHDMQFVDEYGFYNDWGHYHKQKCTLCDYVYLDTTEEHVYLPTGYYQSRNESVHVQQYACVCGNSYYGEREPHTFESAGIYVYVDESTHALQYKCTACDQVKYGESEAHDTTDGICRCGRCTHKVVDLTVDDSNVCVICGLSLSCTHGYYSSSYYIFVDEDNHDLCAYCDLCSSCIYYRTSHRFSGGSCKGCGYVCEDHVLVNTRYVYSDITGHRTSYECLSCGEVGSTEESHVNLTWITDTSSGPTSHWCAFTCDLCGEHGEYVTHENGVSCPRCGGVFASGCGGFHQIDIDSNDQLCLNCGQNVNCQHVYEAGGYDLFDNVNHKNYTYCHTCKSYIYMLEPHTFEDGVCACGHTSAE